MAKKREVAARLNPPTFQALQKASDELQIPKSELVERLITDYLQPLCTKLMGGFSANK